MGDSQALHVFDLPQIYAKPPAEILLDTLLLLTSAPPSWEGSDTEDEPSPPQRLISRRTSKPTKPTVPLINPDGLTRYLTNIIGSDLQWIQDEEAKEEVWHQASLRLSELSGRSAMPAMTRKFRIPTQSEPIELAIHEPALTADNLGLKTWAASYLLAKRLHILDLPSFAAQSKSPILELGSGTGLVGIAAAAVFGTPVVLTDLPEITSNLFRNVQMNAETVKQYDGLMECGTLDWTQPDSYKVFPEENAEGQNMSPALCSGKQFETILAADSLYSPEHPRLLVQTIKTWLSPKDTARVLVEFPYRDAYLPELRDFQDRMHNIGLRILEEGEETGFDDWGSVGKDLDSRNEVKCWWSLWGRKAG